MSAVDGVLYAATADGALGAVAATDGARRWTAYLPAAALGGAMVVSGKAYGCTADGVVFRADLQSGDWVTIATVEEPVVAGVVPGAGRILVFGAAGGVFAVAPDAEGFDLLSRSDSEDPAAGLVPPAVSAATRIGADLAGQPGLMDSLVLAGSAGGMLVAVDAASGRVSWSSSIHLVPTSGFAYDGSALYAVGSDGEIVALALDVPADTTPLLGSDRIWDIPAGGAFRMDSRFVEFRFVPETDGVMEWSVASSDPSDELIVTLRDAAGTVVATNMGKVMLEKNVRAAVTAGDEWRIRVERTYPDRSAVVTLSSRFIR